MPSKSTFRACVLVLSAIHYATSANVGEIAMDAAKPMDVLMGEYALDEMKMENYRPTWAAVWKIDKMTAARKRFTVAMWPVNYCHAVYICPVPAVDYKTANFKTVDGMCEDTYLKYYPHAKKMVIKSSKGGTEETMYWMNNKIAFSLKTSKKLTFDILESLPANYSAYETLAKAAKTKSIDFDNQDLLILTNSRMCQVQKVGGAFYPFFQKSIVADTTDTFPFWMRDPINLVHTDALYPHQHEAKMTDLLAPLKAKKWENTGKIGGYTKRCDSQEGIGGLGNSENIAFMQESVMSYTFYTDLSTPNAVYEFSLEVNDCHWFRVWFAKRSDDMSKYNTSKTSEYVTFFLNEGFYVGPGSNKAFPLPDAADMNFFRFRAFDKVPKRTPQDDNLIEIAMGSRRNRDIFREYIIPSTYIKEGFELHVIMAPACDLKLAEDGLRKKNTVPNNFQPTQCRLTYFKD